MRRAIVTAAGLWLCACSGPASKFCGPSNCAGCCNGVGECLEGTENDSCGNDGERCRSCTGDSVCRDAVCAPTMLHPGTGGGGGFNSAGGGTGGGLANGGGFGGGAGGTAGGSAGGGGDGPHNDAGFPAAHPAFPQERDLGGPVLASPRFVSITFANDNPAMVTVFDEFISTVGATPYWSEVTGEYGIGPGFAGPAVHVPENAPSKITGSEIETWLQQHLTGPAPLLGAPDPNTVYVLAYPPGVQVDALGTSSCVGFGGYHAMTTVNGAPVVYAVVPRCPGFIPTAQNDIDNLTGVASHELIEAVTDPMVFAVPAWAQVDDDHMAWNMIIEGELADLCAWDSDAFYRPTGYNHMVQRSWSNQAAALGSHACVPALDSSFGAVAELDEMVDYRWIISGETKGVSIPIGQMKTIYVDLFSDEPQPLFVSAVAFSSGYTLDLDFLNGGGRGWNGDRLELTIRHVSDEPGFGGAPFVLITTAMNGASHYSFGFVGD